MNLQQMHYISVIAKEGSINKAAQKLYVAQPSLSRMVKHVEKEYGFPIFDRSTNPLSLTQYGKQVLEFIDTVLFEQRQLDKRLIGISNAVAGEIRIATTQNFGTYYLPEILSVFRNTYPDITITLKEFDNIALLEDALQSGQFDLGCLTMAPISEHITFEPLIQIETLLAIPPAFLQEQKPVSQDTLRQIPYILMRENFRLRKNADLFFEHLRFTPQIILETGSVSFAYNLCGMGIGATFVHVPAVFFSKVRTTPIFYHLEPNPIFNDIGFTYRSGLHPDKTAQLFMSLAKKVLQGSIEKIQSYITTRFLDTK